MSTLLRLGQRLLCAALLLSLCTLSAAMAQAPTPAPAAPPAATAPATPPAAAAPAAPAAAAPNKIDSGDTAWMLTSTALVLMMTIPGLALFYGGMVRKMNVLATVMQSFAVTCLVTVLWTIVGYSLAFTEGNEYFGGLSRFMLMGMGADAISDLAKTIPESVYMCFQMTFAIITPALICGAFADRMKFSALLWFIGLWSVLVYAPIAHWVWGPGGFLGGAGVLDFAGGTVVHINAGVAGLMCCLVMGKRRGYRTEPMPPHNLVLSVIGASLLWVGWFGFNAGSNLESTGGAPLAMINSFVATAAAALSWMFAEWLVKGKPSLLGAVSGCVAGLVAVTPASGYAGPMGALVLGLIAGVVCLFFVTSIKNMFGYDDALDVFGVHCIGGIIGAIGTGILVAPALGGTGIMNYEIGKIGDYDFWAQVIAQGKAVGMTLLWSGIGSFIIFKVVDLLVGLRPTMEAEREGLDLTDHNERAYNM